MGRQGRAFLLRWSLLTAAAFVAGCECRHSDAEPRQDLNNLATQASTAVSRSSPPATLPTTRKALSPLSTVPTAGLTTTVNVYSVEGAVWCEVTVFNVSDRLMRVPRFADLLWTPQITREAGLIDEVAMAAALNGGARSVFDGGDVKLMPDQGFVHRAPLPIKAVPRKTRYSLKATYSAYRQSDVPPIAMRWFAVAADGTVSD